MPTKKGKKTTKKATVDKSHKQTVRQSVIVNVNTKDTSKTKKRQSATNVKSFTKGMTYMSGTPFRSMNFPILQHNILSQQPAHQPVFQHDVINRLSALENIERSRITDEQQARSVVTPLATATPTATKPIGILETPMGVTPDAMRDTTPPGFKTPKFNIADDTLKQLETARVNDMDDIQNIMRASTLSSFENPAFDASDIESSPTGLTPPAPTDTGKVDRSPYQTRDKAETSLGAGPSTLAEQFQKIQEDQAEKTLAKLQTKKQPTGPNVATALTLFEQIQQENAQKAAKQTRRPRTPKNPPSADDSSPTSK